MRNKIQSHVNILQISVKAHIHPNNGSELLRYESSYFTCIALFVKAKKFLFFVLCYMFMFHRHVTMIIGNGMESCNQLSHTLQLPDSCKVNSSLYLYNSEKSTTTCEMLKYFHLLTLEFHMIIRHCIKNYINFFSENACMYDARRIILHHDLYVEYFQLDGMKL